jgi:HEAT repeat protein
MAQEYIEELIGRMSKKEDRLTSSDESVRWKACREAEKLKDPIFYSILKEFILSHSKPKEKEMRDSAYFILGKLLLNTPLDEYIAFFLKCLEKENDKYILSQMLDRISDLTIPAEFSVKPIIALALNDKWQIRQSAIRALGASATAESIEMLAYYINQTDTKAYKYEIEYANAALGRIGTEKDIYLLEQHTTSRMRDIRETAKFAIERIKSRTP